MSYATEQEAREEWVPKDANILLERDGLVIYTWEGKLHVLSIFPLVYSHHVKWHVSMDLTMTLEQLTEVLK